jgi:predicted ATPase
MRITKLSLTNFRSFKVTQTIEFAPVTLLFGPNSVGKSTVLMALFYLQQILDKGQCNPMRIEALGDKFVGGFKNLVHGKDLKERIKIKISFSTKGIGSTYERLNGLFGDSIDFQLNSPASQADEMAVELEVAWSATENTAYVASYKVFLDDIEAALVDSDSGLKQPYITSINYLHPLLLPEDHDDWLTESFDDQLTIHNGLFDKLLELKDINNPTHREIANGADRPFEYEEDVSDFSDDCFTSLFHESLNDSRIPRNEYNNSSYMTSVNNEALLHAPIGIKGFIGALPPLGRILDTSLSMADENLNAVLIEILSDMLVAPLDNLLAILKDSLNIGPLRTIPDSTYSANPYPQQVDWYNGLAAWDTLATTEISTLRKINSWISERSKLDLGYSIAIKVEKSYAEIKKLSLKTDHEKTDMQLQQMIQIDTKADSNTIKFDEHQTNYTYTLWDSGNRLAVTASDIGVGVSQLMPLIVAALSQKKGLIACEQPELHVHPRVQVAIGDLLTQSNSRCNFLIETHSEHLILRLLRRIRQTTDKELPENYLPVRHTDISIIYIEPSDTGAKSRKIEVDEEGEFKDRWPQGFFSERREEYL